MKLLKTISQTVYTKKNKPILKIMARIKEYIVSIMHIFFGATVSYGIIYLLFINSLFPQSIPIIVLLSIIITICSMIVLAYTFGIVCPILEYVYKKDINNRVRIRKQYNTYLFISGLFISPIMIFGSVIFSVLYIPRIIASFAPIILYVLPTLYTYQFLYKPARAGKLPQWVQRVLGRRNSIVQLRDDIAALADSPEHNTDNLHFTENT